VQFLDNMSNWLGFSLTPHLRIDDGFGRETHQDHGAFPPHLSVMPLRSDGSLCLAADGNAASYLSTLHSTHITFCFLSSSLHVFLIISFFL
jgi:hypothetical protein